MDTERLSQSFLGRTLRSIDRHAAWIGLAAACAIVAQSLGVYVAIIFAVASVVGYLNAFVLFRYVIAALFIGAAIRPKTLIGVFCICGSAGLIWLGHWEPLTIITLSCVVIDAVVLRFRR